MMQQQPPAISEEVIGYSGPPPPLPPPPPPQQLRQHNPQQQQQQQQQAMMGANNVMSEAESRVTDWVNAQQIQLKEDPDSIMQMLEVDRLTLKLGKVVVLCSNRGTK